MGSQIGKLVLADFAIQAAGFFGSIYWRTEKFYDITGSLTFTLLASLSYHASKHTMRQTIQSTCVTLWALRLGSFLFYRVLKVGKDWRFNKIKNSLPRFFFAWMMQGAWVFMSLLPTLYLNEKQIDRPLTKLDYAGWGMWAFGFIWESLADHQKMKFKSNPANERKFIRTGLWKYSRHANYFGEICAWLGLYISSSHMLEGNERWLGLMSPVFVTSLLCFLSGIPLLEARAQKLFASDSDYQEYRRRTPILIPFTNFFSR